MEVIDLLSDDERGSAIKANANEPPKAKSKEEDGPRLPTAKDSTPGKKKSSSGDSNDVIIIDDGIRVDGKRAAMSTTNAATSTSTISNNTKAKKRHMFDGSSSEDDEDEAMRLLQQKLRKKHQKENESQVNSSSNSRCVVNNPYKKPQSRHSGEVKSIDERNDVRSNGEKHVMGETSRDVQNPYKKIRKTISGSDSCSKPKPRTQSRKAQLKDPPSERELQAGLVFEEDVNHIQQNHSSLGRKCFSAKSRASKNDNYSSEEGGEDDSILTTPSSARAYVQHQVTTRVAHNLPPILYHDLDFVAGSPATVDGSAKSKKTDNHNPVSIAPPKCKCRPAMPCSLAYSSRAGPNFGRPYHCCQRGEHSGCKFFSWAFTSHMIHWYRFGPHNGHVLVKPNRGFRAEDLVQGKVGDCWFLSALAVVAERDDLIGRLIGSSSLADGGIKTKGLTQSSTNKNYGVIEVKLFVDGYWKTIITDDFLPCLIDETGKEEECSIQLALRQSLVDAGINPKWHRKTNDGSNKNGNESKTSSKFDPNAMADVGRRTLSEIHEFLHHDRFSKDPSSRSGSSSFVSRFSHPIERNAMTSDLAYSKARNNQLWVPFLEKAYAKAHGSYCAISGGHVEEAFLDLTGAPTAVYNFDHHDFDPRSFWTELMSFRRKHLPMGCGTSTSQGGIVGMHAYSILDVREVRNVDLDFFRDKIATGALGNVSGYTELDGTVRLLRIRNPHGQGEWKGEFSDKSPVWERLMANKNMNSKGMVDLTATATAPQSPELKRTHVNDGTFWIDYDSFLMGFSNVDVVLAFKGNHAKSFGSSFPTKTSNHRCSRAFELSAIGRQPGEEGTYTESVEVFVMIIQKTRRGASRGRADRKVSYKACDTGILVGERSNTANNGEVEFGEVDGRFFGMNRNGHIRLMLDRRLPDRKLIVMPVSFGHPAATDEDRSFVVRVVSDAPLLVQELRRPPKLNIAMMKFCFGGKVMSLSNCGTSRHRGTQGTKTVLMEHMAGKSYLFKILRIDCLADGGGTSMLYLVVNDECLSQMNSAQNSEAISFSIEINCRGMICRTVNGLVNHEVISKGKKFEAAWRRFTLDFTGEMKSRLLATCVQGGADYQMGSIKCSRSLQGRDADPDVNGPMSKYTNSKKRAGTGTSKIKCRFADYEEYGVFASVETPSNILRSECIDLSSTSFQLKNRHYKNQTNSVGVLYPDSAGVDQNIDAAIMASIMEKSTKENSATETPSLFDQEIKKAIALSLKDK